MILALPGKRMIRPRRRWREAKPERTRAWRSLVLLWAKRPKMPAMVMRCRQGQVAAIYHSQLHVHFCATFAAGSKIFFALTEKIAPKSRELRTDKKTSAAGSATMIMRRNLRRDTRQLPGRNPSELWVDRVQTSETVEQIDLQRIGDHKNSPLRLSIRPVGKPSLLFAPHPKAAKLRGDPWLAISRSAPKPVPLIRLAPPALTGSRTIAPAAFTVTRKRQGGTTPRRSPELVWRAAANSNDGTGEMIEAAAQRSSPTAPTLFSATVTAPGPSQSSATATILAGLEQTQIERIAEDVISRIERRMRIERERRGV